MGTKLRKKREKTSYVPLGYVRRGYSLSAAPHILDSIGTSDVVGQRPARSVRIRSVNSRRISSRGEKRVGTFTPPLPPPGVEGDERCTPCHRRYFIVVPCKWLPVLKKSRTQNDSPVVHADASQGQILRKLIGASLATSLFHFDKSTRRPTQGFVRSPHMRGLSQIPYARLVI